MTAPQIGMVLVLICLEIVLSMDNALAIAAIIKDLQPTERAKALAYGIWGAVGFRLTAIFIAQKFFIFIWFQYLGSVYLLFLSFKYFYMKKEDPFQPSKMPLKFWQTVILVEFTDIIFSSDSIFTALTVSSQYWVIVTGGIAGIIAMRFAASFFASIMKKYPRLEDSAYILISAIAIRILLEGAIGIHISEIVFFVAVIASFIYGFSKKLEEETIK